MSKSAAPARGPRRPTRRDRTPRAPAVAGGARNAPLSAVAEPTQKLHKVLAQTGLGSRRDMELLIRDGRVTVNDKVATIGARVGSADQIKVAGRIVRTQSSSRLPRVLLYHKSEGEIASRDDPRGRPSVFDRLPAVSGAKWISIGRLDFNSCGLLLFTTSGELANRMMHPRFELEREYAVRVMGKLQPEHVQQLVQGVVLDDVVARCDRVELRGGEGTNQWCHVVLREGRNRVVRRLFEKLGFVVSRLMRVRYGPMELPSRVKRNQYYELTGDETQRLLDWLDAPPQPPTAPPARGRGVRE